MRYENQSSMRYLILLVTTITLSACATAQKTSKTITTSLPSSSKIDKWEKKEGFFTFWWDETEGKIWLQINKLDTEFLYVNSLPAGVGSNDIGLDRGQLGSDRVVKFIRSGNKILLVQPNYKYRAVSDNALEKRSVEEAFAQSVLWGFKVDKKSTKERVIVDATDFLLRDAHDVTGV